jgi:diguanylate cyclase (GGDEF)-like protein
MGDRSSELPTLFPVGANSRRILVAEDDAVYRRVLQALLQQANFEATVVSDGLQALEAARTPDAPRLLILDWLMPGLQGPEICRKLREDPPTELYQYMVLLSAKDGKADTVEGLEAGADDYLTKPFDAQELLARIRAGMRILELQDRLLEAGKKLQYEATHDPLTGLWNRLAWMKLISAEFERACRKHCGITVLMIDIDHFKGVNDSYGHSAGDAVLRVIGDTLGSMVRTYDIAGRYGGEEFIVVASDLDQDASGFYADRIRSAISALKVSAAPHFISVSVSIGVAHTAFPQNCTADQLVRAADHALYKSKARGRNCVMVRSLDSELMLADRCELSVPAVSR